MLDRASRAAIFTSVGALWSLSAQAASLDEMAETIRALQARVETLEARSRRDQAELRTARRGRVAPAPAQAPRPLITKDVPLIAEPTPAATLIGFEGAYAAILGGYNFGPTGQTASTFFGFESTALSSLSNGRVGVAAGYNRVIDGLLFGIEGRIRTDFGQTEAVGIRPNSAFPSSLPYTFSFGGSAQSSFSDFQLNNSAISQRVLSRDVGGDLVARFGITLDDWLFYGRLGAGMEALRVERTVDETASITCVNPVVRSTPQPFGGFTNTVVACGTQRNGTVTRSVDVFASPYAVMGVGVERNFGPMFARIEGNFYLNLPPTALTSGSGTSYATDVLGAVGYRF